MGIIFYLSHQPGGKLPEFHISDKIMHILAYGALSAASLFAVISNRKKRSCMKTGAAIIVFCLIYGITDEFHQSFIPGRTMSVADLVADFTGAVLAVAAWLFWTRNHSPGSRLTCSSGPPDPGPDSS